MVCKLSPLFEYAPMTLNFITIIGATTALFASTIALTQFDIKRVIAYSTCSQLGYMFFAAGLSAYPAAIFHLTTHAFFKALLFLGAFLALQISTFIIGSISCPLHLSIKVNFYLFCLYPYL